MSSLRTVCARLRVTTVVIVLLQIAFLILFGFQVRYSDYAMPDYPPPTEPATQNASSTAPVGSSNSSNSSNAVISATTQMMMMPSGNAGVPSYSSSSSSPSWNNSGSSSTAVQLNSPSSPAAGFQVADDNSTAGQAPPSTPSTPIPVEVKNMNVLEFYPMFQDIHVMMFIGFGFLMTFLKKYGYSSVGFNFLLAAFVLQWATLTNGWILNWDKKNKLMYIDMETLINADFAAAAILISFGAVLGKLSALQLIIMAFIEVVAYQANELFVFKFLKATDIGDSMVVHTFGAYFGLMVAWINYRKETKEAEDKNGSSYQSDIFSMIGTIFLWLFWPSFNGGTAVDEGRLRAVINTYYSLTASCIVTFAMSALVQKDKFNMVHVQNSTLAGGVAVGTLADMIIQPWGAILVGAVAGCISVLGFRYLTPFLSNRLKLHDTCGVNNLHGMPGLISGLGSILAAGLATPELYGDGLTKIFAPDRTAGQLAAYQAAAIGVSFGMGIACGTVTGIILRIPIWNVPTADEIFDDDMAWVLPRDADDDSLAGKTGQYRPSPNQGYENAVEMQGRGRKDEDY